jgi:hypothetical protein
MGFYEGLYKKSDRELVEYLGTEVKSYSGTSETMQRIEVVKAILAERNNERLLKLTKAIYVLTGVLVVLGVLSVAVQICK